MARRNDSETIDTVKRFAPLFSRHCTPDIVLVDQPGVIHAMATGLDHVTGEVVAITDDDAVPHEDWLERIEAVLARFAARSAASADATSSLVNWAAPANCTSGLEWSSGGAASSAIIIWDAAAPAGPCAEGRQLRVSHSAAASGGFDRRLKGAGAQVHFELGIGLELIERGWSLVYDPAILVDHFPAPRLDYDKRNSFNARAVSDAVHNETVLLLQHLSAPRRAA